MPISTILSESKMKPKRVQSFSLSTHRKVLPGKFIYSLIALFLGLYFTSCEKVINVNLNDAEKKYVIEAVLTNEANSCKVIISQTKNFDENNTMNGVSGASVTLTDNNGTPVTLNEKSVGVYEATSIVGAPGHTYNLSVKINNQIFTATSTMPALIPFDSLYISERTFFDETNKYATISFLDPVGKGNAYKYILYKNGVKEKTIFVRDDDLSDGRKVERTLLYFYEDDEWEQKKIRKGDNIKVEMLCISNPVYKFWYSLAESSTGEGESATPGNPVTNIHGGALGYFSAHTIQSKTITVP